MASQDPDVIAADLFHQHEDEEPLEGTWTHGVHYEIEERNWGTGYWTPVRKDGIFNLHLQPQVVTFPNKEEVENFLSKRPRLAKRARIVAVHTTRIVEV